ncbi:MAG: ribonuclease M5 [Erysipelotrichaceae bacterium]|nr:ribonuclease M5 [Erysipelotrichaceae bacterium]
MKPRIDDLIVVEGKNDAFRIRQVFDADILITGGLAMPEETMNSLREIAKIRGVIVFTDPDGPGNRIRHAVSEIVPDCKHAYVQAKNSRFGHKVGVEHASPDDIREALQNLSKHQVTEITLSSEDYICLGLSGGIDSKEKRQKVAEALHIGYANGKTFYKRLNMVRADRETVERILADESDCHSIQDERNSGKI